MKKIVLTAALILMVVKGFSQPELSSWMQNTGGQTGFYGLPSNVQSVDFTLSDVYISCSCIPGYDIGPWQGNPNQAENQNFCYKITRNPQEAVNHQETNMGHIGVWSNGVSIFNAKDGFSYNNQGVWNQDALVFEGSSFDECLGHPAPNGEYHNHINPTCLYDDLDDQNHSPIIGYAFDGFPVYGAYAFANTDGTGEIKRMETSYQLRSISQRHRLPDGTVLSSSQYGPEVGTQYPLGSFLEDYEYVQNSGDLNEFNGRYCVTPDYPDGVFAYFVTIDENGDPEYPYTIGPSYYGTVQNGNTGPRSGHNTIPVNSSSYQLNLERVNVQFITYPNPVSNLLFINSKNRGRIFIYSLLGDLLVSEKHESFSSIINLDSYLSGVYIIHFESDDFVVIKNVVKF